MPASAQARSGNPAKRAAVKKAASGSRALTVSAVEDWGDDEGELIELPSGKVVRIERISIATLIAENLLGDSLSVMAAKAVEQGQGLSPDEMKDMAKDPAKVAEALDAFDQVAARAITEPQTSYYKWVTGDKAGQVVAREDRTAGVLYTDKIDLNDKVFLFQVITGGTSDLQRFRGELAESVAGISAG